MKISKIETIPLRVPLKKPFTYSAGTEKALDRVIVKVWTDDGVYGLGEASPDTLVWEETLESILYAIRRYIEPTIVGFDVYDLEKIIDAMDMALPLNTIAKAAIDVALYDILGKALGVPVYRLLGGCFRHKIRGQWEVSLAKPKEMAKEAKNIVDVYNFQLKPCVGTDPRMDVERIKAIREAIGYDIDVTLSAEVNMGWRRYESIKTIKEMEKYELTYVEQPLPRWDINGLAHISKAVDTLILADESLRTTEDAINLIKSDAVGGFNIKMIKCGGISRSKKIVTIAEAAGMPFYFGTNLELGVGTAAGTHLAASVKEKKMDELGCGFVMGTMLVEDDVLQNPLRIENGYINVPKGPGLGIELDEHKIKKYARHFSEN